MFQCSPHAKFKAWNGLGGAGLVSILCTVHFHIKEEYVMKTCRADMLVGEDIADAFGFTCRIRTVIHVCDKEFKYNCTS